LLHKSAFSVENGNNRSSIVDINNLADAYLFLVEKALESAPNNAFWDSEGYYFVATGELVRTVSPTHDRLADNSKCWGTFATGIGELMHELFFIDEPVVCKKLTADEVDVIYAGGSVFWGASARCQGSRLRQLGWEPKIVKLNDYVRQRFSFEIENLYGITVEEQELETESRAPRVDSVESGAPVYTSPQHTAEENEPDKSSHDMTSTEASVDIDAEVASGRSPHLETSEAVTTDKTSMEKEIKRENFDN
jgi:hypothetical protein